MKRLPILVMALGIALLAAVPAAEAKQCRQPDGSKILKRSSKAVLTEISGRNETVVYGCAFERGKRVFVWGEVAGQMTLDSEPDFRLRGTTAIADFERSDDDGETCRRVTRRVNLLTGKRRQERSEQVTACDGAASSVVNAARKTCSRLRPRQADVIKRTRDAVVWDITNAEGNESDIVACNYRWPRRVYVGATYSGEDSSSDFKLISLTKYHAVTEDVFEFDCMGEMTRSRTSLITGKSKIVNSRKYDACEDDYS